MTHTQRKSQDPVEGEDRSERPTSRLLRGLWWFALILAAALPFPWWW